MTGSPADPSTTPLAIAFAGAAAASATVHNRIARAQALRDRQLDLLLAALPTVEGLKETEERIGAVLRERPHPFDSWIAWWCSRPRSR